MVLDIDNRNRMSMGYRAFLCFSVVQRKKMALFKTNKNKFNALAVGGGGGGGGHETWFLYFSIYRNKGHISTEYGPI